MAETGEGLTRARSARILDKQQHGRALPFHLAIEKSLKAAIMEQTDKPHPKVHDLLRLASQLRTDWPAEDTELLDNLSDFAVAARYDDPGWAEHVATAKNARKWISRTDAFLTTHSLL